MDVTRRCAITLVAAACVVPLTAARVNAAAITLTNRNTTIQVDPTSEFGLLTWTVDGVDQIVRQWFWLSTTATIVDLVIIQPGIDEGCICNSDQLSLDKLRLDGFHTSGNTLTLVYSDDGLLPGPGLSVQVAYTVFGGLPGSSFSRIVENVSIERLLTVDAGLAVTADSVNWIQFTDLNLNGVASDDVVANASSSATRLLSGNDSREATILNTPARNSNDLLPPVPVTNFEVSDSAKLLVRLLDPSVTTLSNAVTPGPGDLAHAVQYELHGPGVYTYSAVMTTVPEPSTVSLLGIGALAVLGRVRRKRTARRS